MWVHCDDSEQAYLKFAMDEIFGREHFVEASRPKQRQHIARGSSATRE